MTTRRFRGTVLLVLRHPRDGVDGPRFAESMNAHVLTTRIGGIGGSWSTVTRLPGESEHHLESTRFLGHPREIIPIFMQPT